MGREAVVYWASLIVPAVLGLLLAAWFMWVMTPRQRRRDDLRGEDRRIR